MTEARAVLPGFEGYLARRHDETTDQAFLRVRSDARSHGRRLNGVAEDVVAGRLELD